MIRALLLLCMLVAPAAAGTRYALVVGNDSGDTDEPRLRYAEHDADRFAATLVELGGFAAGDVVVLRGTDADAARAALIALNDRIRTSGAPDAMLVVYYSGHADAETLHLGTSTFALPQLEQLVRGSPAAFRLLVVDACRSGQLTRVKGGRVAAPFPIALGDALAADGVVFWTASAASEQAQESDDIKGSFFSHFLVSGLAGPADVDGDGVVTTVEAYEYARGATLRASSRTLAGTQHPTFRDELAGRDSVVLTRPGTVGAKRAILRVPDNRDVLVLAGSSDGPVIAEVGVHDTTRRLNVRAGRYFIRERTETHLLEGTLVVVAGADRLVADSELTRVEYQKVVAKGRAEIRRDAIEAGLLVRTSLVEGACAGAIAGYAIDRGWLTITPRIAVCRETAANEFLATNTDELAGDVRLAHAWKLSRMSLSAQVQAGGGLVHQQFMTTGVAPSRTSGIAMFGAGGGVAVPLGGATSARLSTELASVVLQRDRGWTSQLALSGILSIEVAR